MITTRYEQLQQSLKASPKTWLVTGVAGFIGSNLLETLLKLDQRVIGLDNFATGYQKNLDQVQQLVSQDQWARFTFHEGDIRNQQDCRRALEGAGVDYVLHQAALGSVPRSIDDPVTSNAANVTGFLNMLVEARDAGVRNFVYAASSSTYGDHPGLPKQEDRIGRPLSPYAVTKYVNELYADVFARAYNMGSTGLRYFNVFGPRQDPDGAYAAVIPKWVAAMLRDDTVTINGDGETSRDFCFVDNAVQANLLAAVYGPADEALVLNVAKGDRTSLNQLFDAIRDALAGHGIQYDRKPEYGDFRPGDVRHSLADISRAAEAIGYAPEYDVRQGLKQAIEWYVRNLHS